MSSVWGMILQWRNTIKVSTELPVATRHRRDMTEKLLKATLKGKKKVQEESQAEVAANLWYQEEEKKWHRLMCA